MRELAQQDLRRFLALDLTRVDVALDVDPQPVGAAHRRRRCASFRPGADDGHRHVPALVRLAVGRVVDDAARPRPPPS